ncbi:MAG: hypothetical protein WAL80_06485 [Xanthobacteraceae bacterium]|jgi:preprotein translocase subunit SecD
MSPRAASRKKSLCSGLLLAAAITASTIASAFAQTLQIEVAQAEPGYDPRTGAPVVNFRMTPGSARAFAELTQKNVGRTVAVIVDGRVISKPVILQPILGGAAVIEDHLGVEEARTMAAGLSAGTSKLEVEVVQAGM